MFDKILIANRGEIAVRLIRAAHLVGARAVAVYATADAGGPWVTLADESYPLAGATATETYLDQAALIAIAHDSGATAVHPGYGFLSENAAFAAACAEAGLVFIGPGPEAIRLMGSKAESRAIAQAAGVPVIPGVDGAGLSDAALSKAAADIGYPVLIKASAGGGGKGMRIVHQTGDFMAALQAARREGQSSFGDDHVLVEKYFPTVHHVEIQVLADHHGRRLHLFERECSVQRRHQKIIEESPSPALADPATRRAMGQAALKLAAAVDYVNAGTVEFVLDEKGDFYFLEMNTRLQVEHPVTEAVTGLDLAAWQIRIAAGERLPFEQSALTARGHAVECRVYAEDPAQGFLPSIGTIHYYRPPVGPGIRVDDGVATGSEVTPYFDPMLAKVVTWGADRAEALARMRAALRQMIVLGVTTNIPYLLAILDEPAFVAGEVTTRFVEQRMGGWRPPAPDDDAWLAAAALEALGGRGRMAVNSPSTAEGVALDPWARLKGWRNVPF